MRNTAPKVFVRGRRCAISRKNSRLCFFGCSGYSSTGASPKTSKDCTLISTLWPFPWLSTSSPVTAKQAPVVMRLSWFSSSFSKSTTHCRLANADPSLRAMNLLLLKLRTHPLTVMTLPNVGSCKIFEMLILRVVCYKYAPSSPFKIRFFRKNQHLLNIMAQKLLQEGNPGNDLWIFRFRSEVKRPPYLP